MRGLSCLPEVGTCFPPPSARGKPPRGPAPLAPGTRSSGPKRKCTSSAALGFWMCFCSLAWSGGCGQTGWGDDDGDKAGKDPRLLSVPQTAGEDYNTHKQVDSQLDFLKTVDKLSLGGGSCPERKDALWNGGSGYEPGWPSH